MVEHILTLSDALKMYYTNAELVCMCDSYGIPYLSGFDTEFAKQLLTNPHLGKNKDFLAVIASTLENRVDEAIAGSSFERRDFHQSMWPRVKALLEVLSTGVGRREVTVEAGSHFGAKAEVRELISSAKTQITVVDTYIGLGTLDSLRDASQPIRLLTGAYDTAIEKDFERHLKEFIADGKTIEVRRHFKLHDRYIIQNDRCWIIGSSLKDAGKKMFTMIELSDTHDMVVKDVEIKWAEGKPFP
jgi:hypothetical protein